MIHFQTSFLTSAADEAGWPQDSLPEFVFLGRSNVGKSTVLNRIANQRQLARVSVEPGRTRLLNFFTVDSYNFRLVDAPGYGYASVSLDQSKSFETLMLDYLGKRANLVAGVLLLDARRTPGKDEVWIYHQLQKRHLPIIFIATKWDKLSQSEKIIFQRNFDSTFHYSKAPLLFASPKNQEWVSQLQMQLLEFLPKPTE